ncbi:ATP-binding protein [Nocardia higoensis]|uniref:ATP-binding protein n=1 Tax=Nocardia higoensis TaxID=228599 RepID=UPI0002F59530|nr:LuxR C-terminal-related transcriptional regulator [Nocardia higoensis]
MNIDEWTEIRRCHSDGESIKGIALRLGMSRNTVRRALALNDPPGDLRRSSGRVTDAVDGPVRDLLMENPAISIAEIARRLNWSRSRTMLARKVTEVREELEAGRAESRHIAAGVPTPATTFIGRRAELRELRRLLGEHKLVSVVGPGGIGKTRLSIQAAYEFRRAFPDGVQFVELAAIRTPELLAQVVCDGLALDNRDKLPEEALVDYLRNRRMLLVLDNCEHVVDAAAHLVTRLLESTSALRVLTTTREYLSIPGEYVYALPPLPTRDRGGAGAVELFAARAAAALSGFEITEQNAATVERICERLDGLPLAIELACARLTVMSLDDLCGLLDHRLSVLTAGARTRASRHRSLQATIDWSYDLCAEPERRLWARLTVFADGFDLPMASRVCADEEFSADMVVDTVTALVAKSVVRREERDQRVRFRMLESIREYGYDRLSPQERAELRARLLDWCVAAIQATASNWYSADQHRHAATLRHNRGNIRAALESVLSPHDGPEAGRAEVRKTADALGAGMFLWACGISIREHRMWLTRVLDMPSVESGTKGRVLAALSLVQVLQGDRESAAFSLHRAHAVAADTGDNAVSALITHIEGLRDMFAGALESARTSMDAAAVRYAEHGSDPNLTAMLRVHRAMLCSAAADVDQARELFAAVHAETTEVGERWFHSYATYGLGLVALLEGDYAGARDFAVRGLRIQQSFEDVVGISLLAELLGWSLAELDAADDAAVLLGAASSMWGSIGRQLYGAQRWIDLRERAVGAARDRIGVAAFDRLWEKGRSMSMSDLLVVVFADPAAPSAGGAGRVTRSMLTPRECEVAHWVAAGLTNRQIAEKLVLSTRTVEGHVEHALRKLGLQRRVELVNRPSLIGDPAPGV